jgi:hypothetical protein
MANAPIASSRQFCRVDYATIPLRTVVGTPEVAVIRYIKSNFPIVSKRIILMVADRFEDRRMQAAYERYCVILNQRDIRVPMDDGEPWRLLFTYHLDAPSSSAQFK